MERKSYILAISGGVDSVAMLDMIMTNRLKDKELTDKDKYVVCHFDHGIRPDSTEVRVAVGELSKKYSLPYDYLSGNLGVDTSEATARLARYSYLRQCCNKYKSNTIVTAHHRDDLIETALLNLLRGTSWRGLAPMFNSKFDDISIFRPMLDMPKTKIVEYASKNNLSWHDDPTNNNLEYLRNYIRHKLIPAAIKKDSKMLDKFYKLIIKTQANRTEIATMLQSVFDEVSQSHNSATTLPRYFLIMLPSSIALELIYEILTKLSPYWHPNSHQLKKALWFIKSGKIGKSIQITKELQISILKSSVQFQNRSQYATLT